MKAEWTNTDSLTSGETTKAILVIDMPKDCDECPCLNQKLWECQADIKRRSSDERPSWCPLKPMPEKKELANYLPFYDYPQQIRFMDYVNGYNACLEELTGETE